MNAVQTSLSSPRFSRILFGIGVALVIAALVVFIVKRSGNSSTPSAAPSHAKSSAINPNALLQGQRQPDVRTNKKWSQLDPKAKAAVRTFIFDGAGEHNLARAWQVAAPSIRQGFTYKQWVHGNELPFQVFPELNRKVPASYTLTEWSPRDFLAEVGLGSTHKTGRVSYTFQIGGHRYGTGAKARWLINYWMALYTPPVRADPSQSFGG
jgi:hypothetical protein